MRVAKTFRSVVGPEPRLVNGRGRRRVPSRAGKGAKDRCRVMNPKGAVEEGRQ